MNISFDGFDNRIITFAVSDTIEQGTPVKISGSGTVAAAGEDESFIGIVQSCRDGIAGVIVRGAVEVKCSDASVVCGYNHISAAESGEIKACDDGILIPVLETDSDSGTAVILL